MNPTHGVCLQQAEEFLKEAKSYLESLQIFSN
jgi:hypothetical protein